MKTNYLADRTKRLLVFAALAFATTGYTQLVTFDLDHVDDYIATQAQVNASVGGGSKNVSVGADDDPIPASGSLDNVLETPGGDAAVHASWNAANDQFTYTATFSLEQPHIDSAWSFANSEFYIKFTLSSAAYAHVVLDVTRPANNSNIAVGVGGGALPSSDSFTETIFFPADYDPNSLVIHGGLNMYSTDLPTNLSATYSLTVTFTAVPEPHEYGALTAVALIGLIALRRMPFRL